MNFPEFLTYCKLKNLFNVFLKGPSGSYTVSIQAPLDDIGLYLIYEINNGVPVISKGQYYKYSDRTIDFNRSYQIAMPEIEKIFFPSK